ncbi:MAG: hypothetical protein HQK58_14125 [Deltaproteobacteria bacterium]|nr:hypothetical protein [Deltaproteobacteria bacterium]
MSDQPHNLRLPRLIVFYSVLGLLVVGLGISSLSITHLSKRLKKAEENRLLQTVTTRTMAVEEYLYRCKAVSMQIAARTVIRQNLGAYNRDEMPLEKLVRLNRPKLNDSMNSSDEIAGICQLDATGEMVVQCGLAIPADHWPVPALTSKEALFLRPAAIAGELYLPVGAPIIGKNDERMGTDIVLLRTSRLRRIIEDYSGLGQTGETILGVAQDGRVRVFFPFRNESKFGYDDDPHVAAIESSLKKAGQKETGVIIEPPYVSGYGPIEGSCWGIVVKMDGQELYASVDHQVSVMGVSLFLLTILGAVGMLLMVRPLSSKPAIPATTLDQTTDDQTGTDSVDRTTEHQEELRQTREEAEAANRELQTTMWRIDELSAELDRAHQTGDKVLADISHELRKDVSAAQGITKSLLDTPLTDEQRDYLNTLEQSLENLVALLDSVENRQNAEPPFSG